MPNYLAQAITASDANNYLLANTVIKARTRSFIIDAVNNNAGALNAYQPGLAEKARNFFNDGNNVYIFSKDDLNRFFNGDPNDPNQHLQFTHCMVIVASLPADDTDANGNTEHKGQQTIVIAGCTEDASNPGNYVTSVNGVSLRRPAAEHPPKIFKTSF